MLAGLHVPTNFQMYRQNSEKALWGGGGGGPLASLTEFVNGCRISTTEPKQMILVLFFSEDNVLSD